MEFISEFELAKDVAKEAGKFLMSSQYTKVESSNGHDVKLELDKVSETLIINKLQKHSSFSILSEEAGWSGLEQVGKPYWIVDPIDGSMNFLQEIPFCCVSVSLWIEGTPVLGVVYDFQKNEMISSLREKGVFINDVRVIRPARKVIEQSVLATGFPSYLSHDDETLLRLVNDVKSYKKIRMLGSAALSLAYVALGRVQAYKEEKIALWDVAAGLAFCSELGLDIKIHCLDGDKKLYEVEVTNLADNSDGLLCGKKEGAKE